MSDIVERLRKLVILDEVGSDNPLARDAADEIERLTSERDALDAEKDAWQGRYYAAAGERDALKKDAAALWMMLDDIDTGGDIAKADDVLYRAIAERSHKRRFEPRFEWVMKHIDAAMGETK